MIMRLTSVLLLFFISFMLFSRDKNSVNSTSEAKDSTFEFSKRGYGNFIIDSETAKKYIGIYEAKLRRFPAGIINDKLSHSVWFDTAAIRYLINYISDTSYHVDGIRIYFMAYDTLRSAPGQYKPHQLSIVMVPTQYGGVSTDPHNTSEIRYLHTDNWRIFTQLYEKYKNKFGEGGLNHGELCPDYCP